MAREGVKAVQVTVMHAVRAVCCVQKKRGEEREREREREKRKKREKKEREERTKRVKAEVNLLRFPLNFQEKLVLSRLRDVTTVVCAVGERHRPTHTCIYICTYVNKCVCITFVYRKDRSEEGGRM
jgi:hypothetical protein